MADDPSVVSRSAILQSITTEASGFYMTVTTVASTFLGGSLLFLDKFVTARTTFSLTLLAVSWIALVGSISCVARVRYLNLKSGRLVLRDDYDSADAIDAASYRYSNLSQWLLIVGMAALVVVGLAVVNNVGRKENATVDNPNNTSVERMEKTIPYGSLRPNTVPAQQTPAQTPTQAPVTTPQPTTQPKK